MVAGKWRQLYLNNNCEKRKEKGVEYYSVTKNKEILPFATAWMDLEDNTLSEISQTEEDKYHMISITCGL